MRDEATDLDNPAIVMDTCMPGSRNYLVLELECRCLFANLYGRDTHCALRTAGACTRGGNRVEFDLRDLHSCVCWLGKMYCLRCG